MTKLTMGKPISVNGITIIPVDKTCVLIHNLGPVCWTHGVKEPVGIVVRDHDGVRAYDIEGQPISVEDIMGKVGGLVEVD